MQLNNILSGLHLIFRISMIAAGIIIPVYITYIKSFRPEVIVIIFSIGIIIILASSGIASLLVAIINFIIPLFVLYAIMVTVMIFFGSGKYVVNALGFNHPFIEFFATVVAVIISVFCFYILFKIVGRVVGGGGIEYEGRGIEYTWSLSVGSEDDDSEDDDSEDDDNGGDGGGGD